jgi:hypothetical protein
MIHCECNWDVSTASAPTFLVIESPETWNQSRTAKGLSMEIQNEQPRQSLARTILASCKRLEPNFAALLALCAVCLIWKALSPIWIPCLAWLVRFIELFLSFLFSSLFPALVTLGGVFAIVMFGFVLAAVGLLIGGGMLRSR